MADSYLKEFDATVIDVKNNSVVLDRTAFYPKGGGQPSDTGSLVSATEVNKVIDVTQKEGVVYHVLDNVPPPVGSRVNGTIEWNLRYTYMRHHSAIHVLSGVTYNLFASQITGGQIHTDRARIDLTLEDLNADRLRRIEDETNKAINASYPIKVKVLQREEAMRIPALIRTKVNLLPPTMKEIRVVEIEGLDEQADGGTHVRNTREIGRFKIIDTVNKGKFNKRIEFTLQST